MKILGAGVIAFISVLFFATMASADVAPPPPPTGSSIRWIVTCLSVAIAIIALGIRSFRFNKDRDVLKSAIIGAGFFVSIAGLAVYFSWRTWNQYEAEKRAVEFRPARSINTGQLNKSVLPNAPAPKAQEKQSTGQ